MSTNNAVATTNNGRMVQCGLFAQLPASEALYPALRASDSYKKTGKGKKKTFVLSEAGKKIVTATAITILPMKSKDKPSLEKVTGFTGQALMAFEQKARKEALDTFFAEFTKLVMDGNNTFDRMRFAANGKVQFGIKPVNGNAGLSLQQLEAKAAALGFKLVKNEEAKTIELSTTTAPTEPAPKKAARSKKAPAAKPAPAPLPELIPAS